MKKNLLYIFSSIILAALLVFFNATVINTSTFKVREETIISDKIDKDLNGLIVTFFSDLHYKDESDISFVEDVVEKINELDSDVVIFGGDLIDHLSENGIDQSSREKLVNSLSNINSNYGKYSILGNHDIDNQNRAYQMLIDSGFKPIGNTNASIYVDNNSFINLIGFNAIHDAKTDVGGGFNGVDTSKYTFVIAHCPDSFDYILYLDFDYMLAGHSHGGQIYLPILNKYTRSYGCQWHIKGKTVSGNKTLDITNGLGTTKYNARLFADAEIVVYRLLSK